MAKLSESQATAIIGIVERCLAAGQSHEQAVGEVVRCLADEVAALPRDQAVAWVGEAAAFVRLLALVLPRRSAA